MNELNVLKSMLSGIRIERNMLIRRTNKTEEDKNDLKIDELQIKALEAAISALSAEGEYIKKEDALKALHDFWDECIGYDGSGTEMMLDNESVINSLPTYSIPDMEKIKTDIAELPIVLLVGYEHIDREDTLAIIDKYIGGNK